MSQTTVLTLSDADSWRDYLYRLPDTDFPFFPEFSQVYEEYGDGRAECFVFEDDNGIILYPFIRRPLSGLAFNHAFTGYFDIVTPYCYGGIIGKINKPENTRAFLRSFRKEFEAFARETRIVSEFIRFHPLIFNAEPWDGLFQELTLNSHNTVIDLDRDLAEIIKGYRPRLRSYIRSTEAAGITVLVDEDFDHVDTFFDMYAQNMSRHGQGGYLNFKKSFFEGLSVLPKDNLQLYIAFDDGKPIAGAFFIRYGEFMDYFLAASSQHRSNLRPSHFLVHQVMLQARDSGIRTFHLGAGRESLCFFKQGFSKQTVPYYVGHHIHNEAVYRDLVGGRMQMLPPLSMDAPYFPLYRSGLD